MSTTRGHELDVAIVGMAGRFPGAPTLDRFWENLSSGTESITTFSDEELATRGVPASIRRRAELVRAAPVLAESDLFDAPFFGYSSTEAAWLDPQHRVFLECAWEALESAGCVPDAVDGLIGVFAGSSLSSYLLYNILPTLSGPHADESFPVMIANDKDFLATRVSYKLNLKGPSVTVQTGCSTSLVAVHMAVQALLNYQCDVALAGGVSVQVPQRTGYLREEGGILSQDGHCRAFDAAATGTLFGSGCGIVVLKRLGDAIADGDHVCAVIEGSAVNNDGDTKVGFTAPSPVGQAQVVAAAHAAAGIRPASISFIECHGTGTALGDPVEVHALAKVFGAPAPGQTCLLGAVKTNIGHLDAAAGVAGLIKTVLALERRLIPPTVHFREPNPRLTLESTPFRINAAAAEWPSGVQPRRAGVSSFGIGGTNAHVVLREAPERPASGPSRPWNLLLLSAKTPSALDTATARMSEYLDRGADAFADVCYTSHVGRKRLAYRRMLVARDGAEAAAALRSADSARVLSAHGESTQAPVAFMFPGGGAQYPGMAAGLYESETVFRREFDRCCDLLAPLVGHDLRQALYAPSTDPEAAAAAMRQPLVGLPALLAVEYALASWWMSIGVKPVALIGHSLGEYAAACLAGVFSIDDALRLVVKRSELMECCAPGAMLIVALSEDDILEISGGRLSVAAVNGPAQCVVSGARAEIDAFAAELVHRGLDYRRMQIDTASHSALVEPVLQQFAAFVSTLKLSRPVIPYVSNVTGDWIRPEDAIDPGYWAAHLRRPVLFGQGITRLLESTRQVLLEVGPGRTLASLASSLVARGPRRSIFHCVRHPSEPADDRAVLMTAVGRLWLAGVEVDGRRLYAGEARQRAAIPLYPFERQRYWIDPPARGHVAERASTGKLADVSEWFHTPSWTSYAPRAGTTAEGRRCLVFLADKACELSAALVQHLADAGAHVTRVYPGPRVRRVASDEWQVPPDDRLAYAGLLRDVAADGGAPIDIVHAWSRAVGPAPTPSADGTALGINTLTWLAQALIANGQGAVTLRVISDGLCAIERGDRMVPEKAAMVGACKVLPQEIEGLTCQCIDLPLAASRSDAVHVAHVVLGPPTPKVVAYRPSRWWKQTFEPTPIAADTPRTRAFRERGVYLITGGLGAVGLHLSKWLASTYKARLVLVGRRAIPERATWPAWLAAHDAEAPMSHAIRTLLEIEAAGGEVSVASADVADERAMREIVAAARSRFGALHGVVHAAGLAGDAAIVPLEDVTADDLDAAMHAKARGAAVIERVVEGADLDFVVLFSSNAAVLGGLGMLPYAAANTCLDAIADRHRHAGETAWISGNWDGWLTDTRSSLSSQFQTGLQANAMTPAESLDAFHRLVTCASPGQVVVSTGDLAPRLAAWIDRPGADRAKRSVVHARPDVTTMFTPPASEIEAAIAALWKELLGLDEVGIHDSFFELGGDSLVGVRMINRLRRELHVEVPMIALFEGPTVAALARVVDGKRPSTKPASDARTRGARRAQKARRTRHMSASEV